jgi:hypothetical protein
VHRFLPTFINEQQHLTKWSWVDKKLVINLSFDPIANPSVGSDKALHTAISLSFGKTE